MLTFLSLFEKHTESQNPYFTAVAITSKTSRRKESAFSSRDILSQLWLKRKNEIKSSVMQLECSKTRSCKLSSIVLSTDERNIFRKISSPLIVDQKKWSIHFYWDIQGPGSKLVLFGIDKYFPMTLKSIKYFLPARDRKYTCNKTHINIYPNLSTKSKIFQSIIFMISNFSYWLIYLLLSTGAQQIQSYRKAFSVISLRLNSSTYIYQKFKTRCLFS